MSLNYLLHFFATVALGLAAVSGLMLILSPSSDSPLSSLYRARITVLFQLTTAALILGILPMAIRYTGVEDERNFQLSSVVMTGMIAVSMFLTRRTYRVPRVEHADMITLQKKLLFYGPLGAQLVMAAVAGAGLLSGAAPAIYYCGLTVLLGLATHQLLRFLKQEGWS